MDIYSAYCGSGLNFSHRDLKNATIMIEDETSKSTYTIGAEGEILDIQVIDKGNQQKLETGNAHQYVPGKYEKWYQGGKLVEQINYRENTNRGKHGDYLKTDVILLKRGEEYKGTITGRYYRGSLVTQRFIYDNGQEAYFWKKSLKELIIKYPNGKTWFYLSGHLVQPSGYTNPYAIINERNRWYWNEDEGSELDIGRVADEVVEYDLENKIKNHICYENNQKVGKGIEDYKEVYYLKGVAVSKRIFESDGTDLDPREVLEINNSQLRTSLMSKIGMERLLKECQGKVIDEDKEQGNRLIRINFLGKAKESSRGDSFFQILQVTCPSTKNQYFLRVPPDVEKCEQARQWTMGVEKSWLDERNDVNIEDKYIKFDRET